jgi:type VI secretion system protein ImpA
MSSESTLDFEALLAPIPGANPAGESLRYAGTYDAIKKARESEEELSQGDWKHEPKVADWRAVTTLATEALKSKTKDLQIAAWLTEALVKRSGFAGMRDGLSLIRQLHERFWDSVHPMPEDGNLEVRAGAVEWLNHNLPSALLDLPLTMKDDKGETYSFIRYQESRSVDERGRKSPELMQADIAEGKITGEMFDKRVSAAPRKFYEPLFADLSEAFDECRKLSAIVDEKFGRDAPSMMAIKKAFEDINHVVEAIVKTKRELEPDPASDSAANGTADATAADGPRRASPGGNLPLDPVDRADALRRLEAIAAYFHRTEPHSPVAYLVQRAVRWGQMPLEQWLIDVIGDESVLAHVRETLGIKGSEQTGT